MSRDIRERATAAIEKGFVVIQCGFADAIVQVVGHGGSLVGGLGEVVAEAAGGGDPGDFGADGLGAADGGDEGACAGELGGELGCSLAVV